MFFFSRKPWEIQDPEPVNSEVSGQVSTVVKRNHACEANFASRSVAHSTSRDVFEH